jgi:hypothetical protein
MGQRVVQPPAESRGLGPQACYARIHCELVRNRQCGPFRGWANRYVPAVKFEGLSPRAERVDGQRRPGAPSRICPTHMCGRAAPRHCEFSSRKTRVVLAAVRRREAVDPGFSRGSERETSVEPALAGDRQDAW